MGAGIRLGRAAGRPRYRAGGRQAVLVCAGIRLGRAEGRSRDRAEPSSSTGMREIRLGPAKGRSRDRAGGRQAGREAQRHSQACALEYACRAAGRPRDRAGGRQAHGEALYHASAALKDDREIVLEAVKQDRFFIEYASAGLWNGGLREYLNHLKGNVTSRSRPSSRRSFSAQRQRRQLQVRP